MREEVGSGAMGVVWKAEDERLGRTVAIKRLLVRYALADSTAEETRRRAMREARIAARLQHRNAIAMFDVAEHEGDPCLVMEFLPSRSLSAVLAERGTLPPHEVAEIGAQVAAALAAAHAVGIVHRDIKPGNILLADNGTVKITDFGISKAVDEGTVTTQTGMAGTPAYLAPEIARGEDPTRASDVFSLGSTLYHAVEGRPPFGTNSNPLALLHAVASGNVPPPRNAGPLAATLTTLMRADPASRPTMQDAVTALSAVPAAAVTPATPGPATPPRPTVMVTQPTAPGLVTAAPPTPPPTAALPATAPARTRPARQPSRPAAQRPARRLSQRTLLLVAVAVVVVLAGVVTTVVLANSGGQQPPKEAGTNPTVSGQQQDDESSAQPTTPSVTNQPIPPESPEVPINWSEAGQKVIDYYGTFGNPDARWNMLSSNAKALFGGRAGFDEYWSEYTDLSSKSAYASPNPDKSVTVKAQVTYTKGDVAQPPVQRTVRVTRENGQLVIDSDAR